MTIFGSQVSIIVFVSAIFSTLASIGGAVTAFADTFGGTAGRWVSIVITGIGLLSLAWTSFIHTIDTAAGQPAPDPTKPA